MIRSHWEWFSGPVSSNKMKQCKDKQQSNLVTGGAVVQIIHLIEGNKLKRVKLNNNGNNLFFPLLHPQILLNTKGEWVSEWVSLYMCTKLCNSVSPLARDWWEWNLVNKHSTHFHMSYMNAFFHFQLNSSVCVCMFLHSLPYFAVKLYLRVTIKKESTVVAVVVVVVAVVELKQYISLFSWSSLTFYWSAFLAKCASVWHATMQVTFSQRYFTLMCAWHWVFRDECFTLKLVAWMRRRRKKKNKKEDSASGE